MIRVRKTRFEHEDAVPLAGWVFADLLLSLSIIFLTSISFDLPGSGGGITRASTHLNSNLSASLRNPSSTDIVEPISEGLTGLYTKFEKNKLLKDIEDYKAKNNLNSEDRIVFMQIIGGFDASKESSDQGTLLATAFVIELHKANIRDFESAGIHISTSERIPKGHVMVRMSLAKFFGK